jgi:hypothetical protein
VLKSAPAGVSLAAWDVLGAGPTVDCDGVLSEQELRSTSSGNRRLSDFISASNLLSGNYVEKKTNGRG